MSEKYAASISPSSRNMGEELEKTTEQRANGRFLRYSAMIIVVFARKFSLFTYRRLYTVQTHRTDGKIEQIERSIDKRNELAYKGISHRCNVANTVVIFFIWFGYIVRLFQSFNCPWLIHAFAAARVRSESSLYPDSLVLVLLLKN